MAFDLRNAFATFLSGLNIILSEIRWVKCLISVDDMATFPMNIHQHVKDIDKLLKLLRQARVNLKLSKSHFFQI